MATWSHRVAELAEVLPVDFDDAEGISRLNSDWRLKDQGQALLILIASNLAVATANYDLSDREVAM